MRERLWCRRREGLERGYWREVMERTGVSRDLKLGGRGAGKGVTRGTGVRTLVKDGSEEQKCRK